MNTFYAILANGRWCILDHPLSHYTQSKNNPTSTSKYVFLWDSTRRRMEGIHRIVVNAPKDRVVDHINGDTFDNRFRNLRVCTQSQNRLNSKKVSNRSSRFKGVYYSSGDKAWVGRIWYRAPNGKRISQLRYSKSELECANWYDQKCKEIFGEFALTNREMGLYELKA